MLRRLLFGQILAEQTLIQAFAVVVDDIRADGDRLLIAGDRGLDRIDRAFDLGKLLFIQREAGLFRLGAEVAHAGDIRERALREILGEGDLVAVGVCPGLLLCGKIGVVLLQAEQAGVGAVLLVGIDIADVCARIIKSELIALDALVFPVDLYGGNRRQLLRPAEEIRDEPDSADTKRGDQNDRHDLSGDLAGLARTLCAPGSVFFDPFLALKAILFSLGELVFRFHLHNTFHF